MKIYEQRDEWPRADDLVLRALSRNGLYYAELRADRSLELRQTADRALVGRFLTSGQVDAVAISDDGARLALVQADPHAVQVRSATSGRVIWRTREGRCGTSDWVYGERVHYVDERHVSLWSDRRALLLAQDERARASAVEVPYAARHYLIEPSRGPTLEFEMLSTPTRNLRGGSYRNVPALRANASVSADGRWMPLRLHGAEVGLFDLEERRHRAPLRRRESRVVQRRVGIETRWWDPAGGRFVDAPYYPDPIYELVPQLVAASPGRPMFAWLRADVLAYGDAGGSEYVEYAGEFGHNASRTQIMMAIDHAGESIAIAYQTGVELFSAPRRASQRLTTQEIRVLAFSPSGLLYARAPDHAIFVFGPA